MIFGRAAGWTLVVLAILMASAEAVMALGTGAYNGLATVDVWTLLVGQTPSFAAQTDSSQILAAVGASILAMPAWVAFAAMGFVLVHVCRKRRARRRVFRSAY
ncbi:MAG: hypothetical protein K2P94_08700 [Rhodospirillaceae bacterium]|nr:hypothetical protein [Rhodospirillaceae bacterium]